MPVKTNLEPTTDFVPSTQWQDVPDGIAVPPGGEYKIDLNTGLRQARWDNPPPPDQVKKVTPCDQQAAATPDHEAEPDPERILEGIYALLGRVVLLPIPLGTKGPDYGGWQRTTYEDTQRPDYRRNLINTIARGGNLGVLEGPPSGRLLARDVDDDHYVDELLATHPWLEKTTRTRAKRGCQFLLRLEEGCEYPNSNAVVNVEHGELRLGGSGGAQSVIWGLHPDGMRYHFVVAAPPLEISLADLDELCPALWQAGNKGGGKPQPEPQPQTATRAGNAKLEQEEASAQRLAGEAQSVAQSLDAFYDVGRKEFVLRVGSNYQSRTEGQFKRDLRFRDLSTKPIALRNWSQTDIALRFVQEHKYVRYVGSLAGYNSGYYCINNEPVLVTTSPILIEPQAGAYPIIGEVLSNLFGQPQLSYFLAWLKLAFCTLRAGGRRKGQAIFLCGEHNCGKSFVQNYIITPLLGGRVAFPYKYLNGDSQFNSELFAAEHLCLDDDVPFTDAKARRRFGTYIKNVTASDATPCFTKYQTPVTLSPFWRLTISTNDEAENLMIVPVLDESLIDKVMLFEAAKHPMPMPTESDAEREAFRLAIAAELPAFAQALVRFPIPEAIRHSRYGVKSYLNPRILELVSEIQPEHKLLEIIDHEIFGMGGLNPWEGTATRLESALRGGSLREQVSRLLYSNNMCGILLNRLARKPGSRVTATNRHNRSFYRITPP
jgi:hypothetical protein